MKIRQHIPAFIDIDSNTAEFKDLEELLNISFVADMKELPGFDKFSLGDNLLMAELNNGKVWWVVGRIEEPFELDLPKWKSNG